MAARPGPDVAIVSLGSTGGLRHADEQLADALRRAGAEVAIARAQPQRQRRTLMLTDLGWALACRRALAELEAGHGRAGALIYSSTTSALLWSRPGAIRFDATSAGNRRGRHGLWQRPLERRRMGQSALLLPWSEDALREAPAGVGHALVVPVAVEPSPDHGGARDVAAVSYVANPFKKGLDRVLAAWRELRAEGLTDVGELVLAGADERTLRESGCELPGPQGGVRIAGMLDRADYRALLRRARVFVCAPRREDYGIAQLEALADGCQLVTSAAPGPYVALPIARALDQRLVGEDLAAQLRVALLSPRSDYAAAAGAALEPFSRARLDGLVAGELLGRLLAQSL